MCIKSDHLFLSTFSVHITRDITMLHAKVANRAKLHHTLDLYVQKHMYILEFVCSHVLYSCFVY